MGEFDSLEGGFLIGKMGAGVPVWWEKFRVPEFNSRLVSGEPLEVENQNFVIHKGFINQFRAMTARSRQSMQASGGLLMLQAGS